jgi:hypothetical protein
MVVYDILRSTLQLGTQNDIFAISPPTSLQMEFCWSAFRQKIREVYSAKTDVGAHHDKAVAQKKNVGKKVVGRKENAKSSQQSQNLLTPANTQISESSTSIHYNI